MRPFIIDDTTKKAIERIKAHAEKNVYKEEDVVAMSKGEKIPVAGDQEGFTCNLPFGYKVVYSIEEQPKAKVRHLSVSVPGANKVPNQLVVEELMQMIGFKHSLLELKTSGQGTVFLEQIGVERQAINVLEVIELRTK